MRLLVTGAAGQMGFEVARSFTRSGHEVIAPTLEELDFMDPRHVATSARKLQADWIINCAAYTQVDQAEQEQDAAFTVNRDAVAELARAMRSSVQPGWTLERIARYYKQPVTSKPLNRGRG